MNPIDATSVCLRKFATFAGIAGRPEFWWFTFVSYVLITVTSLANEIAGAVVCLALLVPLLAAGSRRLHDTSRSGWWQFVVLIPVVGFIVYIVLMARPGKSPTAH